MQAGSVLNQVEFMPRLMEKLSANPDEVAEDLLSLRRHRDQLLLLLMT